MSPRAWVSGRASESQGLGVWVPMSPRARVSGGQGAGGCESQGLGVWVSVLMSEVPRTWGVISLPFCFLFQLCLCF